MKTLLRILLLNVVPICLNYAVQGAAVIGDSFDSGTDSAWTRYDPLAGAGAGATFSFPNGLYQIQGAVSPDPTTLGPIRAASVRYDLAMTGYQLEEVEIHGWDNNLKESFGLLSFVQPLTHDGISGYALTYSTSGLLSLSIFRNDVATVLASKQVTLKPDNSYRLLLADVFGTLNGAVYTLDGQLVTLPIGIRDSTYSSGGVGLHVANNDGSGGIDVTFDNFTAFSTSVPEPSIVGLMALGCITVCGVRISRRRHSSYK